MQLQLITNDLDAIDYVISMVYYRLSFPSLKKKKKNIVHCNFTLTDQIK